MPSIYSIGEEVTVAASMFTELHQGRKIALQPFFDQQRPNPRYRPGDPPLFSFVPPRIYTLDLHTKGQTSFNGAAVDGSFKAGPPVTPPAANVPIYLFKWLPFNAGSITFTAVDQQFPILTGLMTGCWLATCQFRGQTWLAHIGTDSDSPANTAAVKQAWLDATALKNNLRTVTSLKAVKPNDHLSASLTVFGLVIRGEFHAISFDTDFGVYTVKQSRHVPNALPAPVFA